MDGRQVILQSKYARIIRLIAIKLGISDVSAMDMFFGSMTFELIQNGVADMHCFSDRYLADEVIIEKSENGYAGIDNGCNRK